MADRKKRGQAASDSSLSRVKSITFNHADESGEIAQHQHTLWLDKRGTPSFVFKVPVYMQVALQVEEQVNMPTAQAAEARLSSIFSDYGTWIKTAKAEPVIVLDLCYSAYDVDGSAISNDASVRFGRASKNREASVSASYMLAFRVNGIIHSRDPLQLREPFGFRQDEKEEAAYAEHNERERKLDMGGGYKVGRRLGHVDGDVLGYTPELHAKIDQVIEALSGAARVLRDIGQAKDKTALLLSLGSGTPMLMAPRVAKAQNPANDNGLGADGRNDARDDFHG